MTFLGWKLYYGDGSIVCSQNSSWQDAPSDNVQILIVFYKEIYKIWREQEEEENYRDMYFGYDYFWQYGNGQTKDVPEGAEIKLGRELPQNEWRTLYNQALKDTKWLQT